MFVDVICMNFKVSVESREKKAARVWSVSAWLISGQVYDRSRFVSECKLEIMWLWQWNHANRMIRLAQARAAEFATRWPVKTSSH